MSCIEVKQKKPLILPLGEPGVLKWPLLKEQNTSSHGIVVDYLICSILSQCMLSSFVCSSVFAGNGLSVMCYHNRAVTHFDCTNCPFYYAVLYWSSGYLLLVVAIKNEWETIV